MYKTIDKDYQIHTKLYNTILTDILPKSGIEENQFFRGLVECLEQFQPRNESLLRKRDAIQAQIDSYHLARTGRPLDQEEYTAFLRQIGYIVPTGPNFQVDTPNIDNEIKNIPGPQLVVPIDNARYALNGTILLVYILTVILRLCGVDANFVAANARWGSLMDAYYGTDAGPSESDGCEKGNTYNPRRGIHEMRVGHQK